jgi:hypothetical protein
LDLGCCKVSIPWLSKRNEVYHRRRYLLILLSLAGESVKALKAAANPLNLDGPIGWIRQRLSNARGVVGIVPNQQNVLGSFGVIPSHSN